MGEGLWGGGGGRGGCWGREMNVFIRAWDKGEGCGGFGTGRRLCVMDLEMGGGDYICD